MFDRPIQADVNFIDEIAGDADYFAAGARADQLRWCEDAVFAEAYDENKWKVPAKRNNSWYVKEALDAADADQAEDGKQKAKICKPGAQDLDLGQVVHMGAAVNAIRLGTDYLYRTSPNTFAWNDREYKITDYKGKQILVPDDQMWGWFEQRKILMFKLDPNAEGEHDFADYDRVVFGTKTDHYTHFPEKFGFMGRRSIKGGAANWKTDAYEARLEARNPRRGQKFGKATVGVSDAQKQNRWDEINEESGLRVKHAPCILMKNQFLTDQDSFISMYLTGSQGTGLEGGSRARPDHVTDHEIYRMFSGKHRERILSNTLFGGRDLKIIKVGKQKNNWWNKNQISRLWRIRNQN